MLNGLQFDRHAEEIAVSVFARSLSTAATDFIRNPRGASLIPNWNRVLAAIPEFFEMLEDAVEMDSPELVMQVG
jgi:glucosyl-3-phosphoglycerate synthase